jgi:hypothetical protein
LKTDPLASTETVIMYAGPMADMMSDLDNPRMPDGVSGRMVYSDGVDYVPVAFGKHNLLNKCAETAKEALQRFVTIMFSCPLSVMS